jgi:putative transposase
VYNLFIEVNDNRYKNGLPYMDNRAFSKWLNNEYMTENSDKSWIKDVFSKAVRAVIDNAHKAYERFFDKTKQPNYKPFSSKQIANAARTGKTLGIVDMQGHPKYKRKGKRDCSFFFVRNSKEQPIRVERHKIKIPCLGWIHLKEKGYIPTTSNVITSGTISKRAGRYYISAITHEKTNLQQNNTAPGIGIDLGVTTFAVISNGVTHETNKQKKLEKKLNREQRRYSRKYELNKDSQGRANTSGMANQREKIAKLHQRLANIRENRQNLIVNEIVRAKPSHVTIEDLNVSGMMKNRHLSKAIANQGFYTFRVKLTVKAKQNGIEVRIAERYYPSSKKCNGCGNIKKELSLKDRTYICGKCGYTADRDMNAARNLRDCKKYKIA